MLTVLSAICLVHGPKPLSPGPMKTAMAKGAFVVLLNETCPHSWVATGYYDSLARAYGRKLNVIGLINTDAAGVRRWKARFKPTYPIFPDVNADAIRQLGGTSAPAIFWVDEKLRTRQKWVGISKNLLSNLNLTMSREARLAVLPLDLSDAPSSTQIGCSFLP
jgi:hypothetical protein